MKFLAMHITNQKLSFDIFMVGNFHLHGTWSLLNILMIFGIKKIDHFDPYNVLLAIAITRATYDWFGGPGSHLSLTLIMWLSQALLSAALLNQRPKASGCGVSLTLIKKDTLLCCWTQRDLGTWRRWGGKPQSIYSNVISIYNKICHQLILSLSFN